MAVKTFTAGEVLTASDTNTYLANSGLVFVKSQTVGSAVATVTVSDAFSATYDNYKIVISSVAAAGNCRITLGSTTTAYYGSLIFTRPNTSTISGDPTNNGARWEYGAVISTDSAGGSFELLGPFLSKKTIMNSLVSGSTDATSPVGTFNGWLDNTTSYTAFTITISGGTMTGGTVTVYGYRKA
jgi:hypothetical protein